MYTHKHKHTQPRRGWTGPVTLCAAALPAAAATVQTGAGGGPGGGGGRNDVNTEEVM